MKWTLRLCWDVAYFVPACAMAMLLLLSDQALPN